MFSGKFKMLIVVGGVLWLLYSFVGDEISSFVLDVPPSDAPIHGWMGEEMASLMERDKWQTIWNNFEPGNSAYWLYLGFMHYLLGAGTTTATAINAWVALWGGLMLVRQLGAMFPVGKHRDYVFFFIIFCPSVVFWSSTNLKEGLMYWSICCMFSGVFSTRKRSAPMASPLMVAGTIVGGLLRPHVIIGWVSAVFAANLFRRGRMAYALLMLIAIPLVLISTQKLTGVRLDVDSAMERAYGQYTTSALSKTGSYIEYGQAGPTFFVSGLVSTFFRPLPWELGSLRFLFAAVETWIITLSLALGWVSIGKKGRRELLMLPEVQAAIVALIWGCALLTYFPNTGLMLRQRVQVIPALLTLAFVPLLYRDSIKARLAQARQFYKLQMSRSPVFR